MLMKELIEQWLAKQTKRVELGKLKPASLDTFTSRVNTHILPNLGDVDIESIRNGVVKQFAETIAQKLGPKTTREVVAAVKMILESHVNVDGEPILDLKWRSGFIFENVKEIGRQKQPTISGSALNAILKNRSVKVRDRVLIALAASTGLRVGELTAIMIGEPSDDNATWSSEASVIYVRKSIYRGETQEPKTLSSIRSIDLSTPLQNMLAEFAKGRQPGEFLFATRSGKPLEPSHVRKYIMLPNGIQGAHACRRYRSTWLEEQGCPRGLLAAWEGHSIADVDAKYDKTAEDREFRRKQVERIGTGLNLADALLPATPGTQRGRLKPTKKSRRNDPHAELPVVKRSLIKKRGPQQPEAAVEADVTVSANTGSPLPQPISEIAKAGVKAEPTEPMFQASDSDLDPMFFEQPAPTPTQEELDAELARLAELRAILEGVN
jgi:integrase